MNRLKDILLELSRYAGVIVVAYILSVIGLGKAMLDWSLWAEDIFFYLSFLLIILEILALVGIALTKDMQYFAMMFFASGLTLFVSILIIGFIALGAPDKFASSHPIPEGTEYHLPANTGESPLVEETDTTTWLQLWNNIQGGSYQYDFYYPALPAGTIYLKCFECGKNEPLSEDGSFRSISQKTAAGHSETSKFDNIVYHKDFTIYEGDWEDYYAARIEVWHCDSLTSQHRKLHEKIYRVDGWMR